MKTLEQIWIEAYLNVATPGDIIRWAEDLIADGDDLAFDPDILELASLPAGNARRADEAEMVLRRIVERLLPNFTLASPQTESYARECLRSWCRRVIAEEITAYQFCRIVQPVEEGFNYPAWLGDFFNQCDWIEPEHEPVDARHLYAYAAEYLAAVEAGTDIP